MHVLQTNAANNAKIKAAKADAEMKKGKDAKLEEFKKQHPDMYALISAHTKQEYEQSMKAQVESIVNIVLAAQKEQMQSQVELMVNVALARAGLGVTAGSEAAADTKENPPTLLAKNARLMSEWSPMAAAGTFQQPPAAEPSKKPGSEL